VIEALARGLPVVSTTVGADGFMSGAGIGIPVADEPEEFAAMLELTDPARKAAAEAHSTITTRAQLFSRAMRGLRPRLT
jgi:glycosyltransferase involved in cell wall biosynthesis